MAGDASGMILKAGRFGFKGVRVFVRSARAAVLEVSQWVMKVGASSSQIVFRSSVSPVATAEGAGLWTKHAGAPLLRAEWWT